MAAVINRSSAASPTAPAAPVTRALLAAGAAAGPLYVLVGGLQMLLRPGFDPLRHDLSLMANGDFGWVQTSLFVLTGLLVAASSIGLRSALGAGPASVWGPRLVALYGIGLIGAGLFAADPAFGFPPGTPADEHAVSTHGLLHLVCGAVGFAGFIGACFVFARRFTARGQRGWALSSRITGAVFGAAFVGIAAGSQQGGVVSAMVILLFTGAVVLGWTWLSAVQLHVRDELQR